MVYLLKMLIFHGYVSHNQMVCVFVKECRSYPHGFCFILMIYLPSSQTWLENPLSHDGSMVLVYMLTWLGYIDGIHGTPYIPAPWILWVCNCIWQKKWPSVKMSGIFPASHVSFPEASPQNIQNIQNFPKDPATSRSLLAKNDKDRSQGGDARNFSWRIGAKARLEGTLAKHPWIWWTIIIDIDIYVYTYI